MTQGFFSTKCGPIKRRILSVAISVALVFLSVASSIGLQAGRCAQTVVAGDLDPSFGVGGKVFTTFPAAGEANSLALQTDGKIVAAGYMTEEAADETYLQSVAVVRYNPDGSLDSGFGTGGRVSTRFSGNPAQAYSLAVQPDGKIVVAGAARSTADVQSLDFALARYNSDGSLDSSFGNGGQVTTDFFGFYDQADAVAIQPDGRIVAAGSAQKNLSFDSADFALARYNADGSLDSSFGVNGEVTTDLFGANDRARALVFQPDGRIVLAGSGDHPTPASTDFALVRYNADGALDTSFGDGGKIDTNLHGNIEMALALALQPDGQLIAAGAAQRNFDFATGALTLARYDQRGALDANFITIGKDTPAGYAKALALQPDGKIVAAGGLKQCGGINCEDFLVARFNADGSVDTSFGTGGVVTTDFFNGFDTANALVIQPDGKMIAAGSTSSQDFARAFALVRYLPEPSFAVGIDPSTIIAARGTKVRAPIAIARFSGFAGEVTLTPSDTSALRIGISPSSVTTSGAAAVFKIKVKANAVTGPHDIIFTATDASGRVRTGTLTVVVE
jgi:uncharacterized delta-60 repeat protein